MTSINEELEAIGIPSDLNIITGTNGHSRNLRFLVTGGCGYFGFNLAKSLYALGAHVCLLDIHLPSKIEKHLNNHFTFEKGNVSEYESVAKAFCNVDFVFHVASYGMSGSDQLCKSKIEKVNVEGTRNVIRACQEEGVERLVYTSTYNVVLGFEDIINGDESLPYADPNTMMDYYSRSKMKADKLVLEANDSIVSGGGTLKTCCLRPAGIFGPGETKHTERIMGYIESRIVIMKPGDSISDWVHVNNLVQAHLLAVQGLSSSTNHIAAGQAYFISDNRPIRMFDFLKPAAIGYIWLRWAFKALSCLSSALCREVKNFELLNHKVPKLTCPLYIMFIVAWLSEIVFYLLKPIYKITPFLTRNELAKMTVNHYHKMDKAINELGYHPKFYEYDDTVRYFLEQRKAARSNDDVHFMHGWIYFLLLIVAVACISALLRF